MARNYISRYLQQAGIKAPYEDMTTAQIEEQNKSNPISGYGFMSGQQKQQRQLQMQLIERENQRQEEMMRQQLIAAMSSQEKIGYYTGSGLMGLMQHLKNRGQAPEVPNVTEDDPELQRYHQLAQEVGPEAALEILGQETGNSQMIAQAAQQRMERQKKELELSKMGLDIQNTQGIIAERAGKPNPVIMTQATGPDGRPLQVSKEVTGKDPNTGLNKYRDLGSAVKGSLTVDDPSKFGTSKGGINERTKAMEGALTSTANAFDSYDKLEKLVKETPAGGWSGALVGKADDILSGLQNLGTIIADAEGRDVKASMDVSDYDFSKMEKFAGGAAKIKSLVLEVAYARAAATGDSSRSLSDRDVQNQIDIVGGNISNPKIFLDLVQQSREMMVSKVENLGKYSKINGKPIGEAYRDDIEGLKKRAKVKTSTGSRTMYRGGKKYNIPEDEVEAFKAAGGSETP